jgi:hypothetical protein
MSAAAIQVRMSHPRSFARVRRMAPELTLQSTATGWGLYDAAQRPVFEADGMGGRLACLQRALSLGVVHLRAGGEPHVA